MPLKDKDDHFLEAIKSGNSDSIRIIYEENFHIVSSMIEKNGGNQDDAKDVFQDGIMVVYQKIKNPNFTLTSSFSTYLYSICKYLWLNQLKKKSRTEVTLNDTVTSIDISNIEEDISNRERNKLYKEKFKQLGEDCQQILKLFFDGIKMKKIAEIMDFSSIQYAKKRKFVCKEKLVTLIENDKIYNELMYS